MDRSMMTVRATIEVARMGYITHPPSKKALTTIKLVMIPGLCEVLDKQWGCHRYNFATILRHSNFVKGQVSLAAERKTRNWRVRLTD
jgi:hypothetical protein